MPRARALIAVTTCCWLASSAAAANPSFTIDASIRSSSTTSLPLTARHVLTLTAGAVSERVSVQASPMGRLSVTGATVEPVRSTTGPSLTTCPGRWNRMHNAYARVNPVDSQATFTIAAGQTATVTADITLAETPFNDDTLDASWTIDLAQGLPFSLDSVAPAAYEGPLGVALDLRVIRAADGSYVVAGTAEPGVERGRVELWGYPPRSRRAVRLARVPVRQGEWEYNRWRPDRRGGWELYARYSGGGREYVDSASECGMPLRVR